LLRSSPISSAFRLRVLFFFLIIRRPPRSTLFPLHDALPISPVTLVYSARRSRLIDRTTSARTFTTVRSAVSRPFDSSSTSASWRSEEHTSELQSRENLVCRLLLEKKKINIKIEHI